MLRDRYRVLSAAFVVALAGEALAQVTEFPVPGACDGAFAQDLNAVWCPTCPKPASPTTSTRPPPPAWSRDLGQLPDLGHPADLINAHHHMLVLKRDEG